MGNIIGSNNPFPSVLFDEQAADIATPAADRWVLYTKSGGVYARNAAGTVVGPFAAATPGGEFPTGNAKVATTETTTSLTYADLTTVGPSVTVTVGASGKVMLHAKCRLKNNTANQYAGAGIVVSGANTIAAFTLMIVQNDAASDFQEFGASTMLTGLAAGSTTFKMQYIVSGGTGEFNTRELTVAPVL